MNAVLVEYISSESENKNAMKKIFLMLIAFGGLTLSFQSCETSQEQKKKEIIEEMKDNDADIKRKKDGDEEKIKMETDEKEVKIKEEDGEIKIKEEMN
ncbi:hypothetical protein Y10_00340 [Neptunitalea sp. Y10]|uniref:Lipoprotein n=2 Tax=Neptunitalea lumnitzerae TaxID=2965509 RepID=A0ABQ5MEC8_9FLAO|nr:hypothetical protein Y10_00340 [Neptunitalea sp. Y10]